MRWMKTVLGSINEVWMVAYGIFAIVAVAKNDNCFVPVFIAWAVVVGLANYNAERII